MATSLKEYLKKYQSAGDEEKQPKKTKKKRKAAAAKVPSGLIIVDNDPAWQKGIEEDEDELEEEGVDAPQVIEDVEVKRMHQLERIKEHRPYMSIGDDGSGWTTVDRNTKDAQRKVQINATLRASSLDASPPRREPMSLDISPPRKRKRTTDSPDASPPRRIPPSQDISPPRRRNRTAGSPDVSPPRRMPPSEDISPPRRRNQTSEDISPPRRRNQTTKDISPPRRRNQTTEDISPPRRRNQTTEDISPPRRRNQTTEDISPPRRRNQAAGSPGVSPPRRMPPPQSKGASMDSSPPRRKPVRMTDGRQAGLIKDQAERAAELVRKKQEDARRLKEMGGGGRAAETVYRDKRGKRLEGLEELLRQQQGEAKPEVKPLEWGKGLAQKREVEEKQAEFEAEKAKPFARTRDDPELDKMFRERVRFGDPMAHLVKRKDPEAELVDLGASEEMKESGFVVPQDIPQHSWLKRGVGAPMNRYGIKPGRHWDGVDRSTGFESQMFKAKAEKQATEMEAYLWSVADM